MATAAKHAQRSHRSYRNSIECARTFIRRSSIRMDRVMAARQSQEMNLFAKIKRAREQMRGEK